MLQISRSKLLSNNVGNSDHVLCITYIYILADDRFLYFLNIFFFLFRLLFLPINIHPGLTSLQDGSSRYTP